MVRWRRTVSFAVLFWALLAASLQGTSLASPPSDTASVVLLKRSIMVGDPGGNMRWDETMSRAEAVKALISAIGLTPGRFLSAGSMVHDIGGGHWAEKWIGVAAETGIGRGYADGLFRPDQPITLAEYAVMLARAYVVLGGRPSEAKSLEVEPVWAAGELSRVEPVRRWLGLGTGPCPSLDFPVTRAQAGDLLFKALQEFGLAFDMTGSLVAVNVEERSVEIEVSSQVVRLEMAADARLLLNGSLVGLSEVPLNARARVVLCSAGVCAVLVVEWSGGS